MQLEKLSIIICTYNPDRNGFSRCLAAVEKLDRTGLEVEVIIVDNNSEPPISELEEVRNFLSSVPDSRIEVEKKQGLTYARVCGVSMSNSPILIFFDDDNEPEGDYLRQAAEFMRLNPLVSVAGPGRVKVEYTGMAENWLKHPRQMNVYFQGLDLKETIFHSNERPNPNCEPHGTGMIVRKDVANKYCDLVIQGKLLTTDRAGRSLSGAGDLQIVWLAVKDGGSTARTASVALTHLINGDKANFHYLKRVTYASAVSWLKARYEIYPEERSGPMARKLLLNLVGRQSVSNFLRFRPRSAFLCIAASLGLAEGMYIERSEKVPKVLAYLVKFFELK